jgi:hypothetical protein
MLTGCGSESKINSDIKICPQCNMELTKSKINTAILHNGSDIYYFDDIGCLALYIKENNIDIKGASIEVFSNDTKKFIDARKANYSINATTPMHYGFSAYENKNSNYIHFDEVILRMLRGEHMANPKIRKQILGY